MIIHEGHTNLPQLFIDEVNKLGFEWDVSSTTVFGRDLDSITNIRDINENDYTNWRVEQKQEA